MYVFGEKFGHFLLQNQMLGWHRRDQIKHCKHSEETSFKNVSYNAQNVHNRSTMEIHK